MIPKRPIGQKFRKKKIKSLAFGTQFASIYLYVIQQKEILWN